MSEAVYLGRNGQRLGPYTRAELAAMTERGEVLATDLAWHEGLAGWQPATVVLASFGVDAPLSPPPLPPAGSARADTPMSQAEMYGAVVGPERAGYYLPIFERFDAGGSIVSWNWPAAFIPQWWMWYRAMYLWGFLFYPILSLLVSMLIVAAASAIARPAGVALGCLIVLPLRFAVMGMYSNRIFHHHVRGLIERSARLGLSGQQRRDWLVRRGSSHFMVLFLVLMMGVAMIGILAAVAIPAYQDYTIRSQVMEGAVLSSPLMPPISRYYESRHAYPADNAGAGLPEPDALHGQYVQRIEIVNGTIRVIFGGPQVNTHIAGGVLVYVPEMSPGADTVHWVCNTPDTTLANKYLPPACRK